MYTVYLVSTHSNLYLAYDNDTCRYYWTSVIAAACMDESREYISTLAQQHGGTVKSVSIIVND